MLKCVTNLNHLIYFETNAYMHKLMHSHILAEWSKVRSMSPANRSVYRWLFTASQTWSQKYSNVQGYRGFSTPAPPTPSRPPALLASRSQITNKHHHQLTCCDFETFYTYIMKRLWYNCRSKMSIYSAVSKGYILKGRWPRFQARAPPISFLTIAGRAAANPPPPPLPSTLTSICTYVT